MFVYKSFSVSSVLTIRKRPHLKELAGLWDVGGIGKLTLDSWMSVMKTYNSSAINFKCLKDFFFLCLFWLSVGDIMMSDNGKIETQAPFMRFRKHSYIPAISFIPELGFFLTNTIYKLRIRTTLFQLLWFGIHTCNFMVRVIFSLRWLFLR